MSNGINALASRPSTSLSPLGTFVDSLLQTFENCRTGLKDETLEAGSSAVEGFFLELYEKERPRLDEHVRLHTSVERAHAAELSGEIDRMIRTVVVPAYVRIAVPFSARERNDFFRVAPHLQIFERIGWALGGIVLGFFVVWAPFIPLWGKEWVLVFFLLGLGFPWLRRFQAMREYEGRLNELVRKTDRELDRIDAAYLTRGIALEETPDAPRRREAEAEKE